MPASAWAREKAEAVCADSVWTDELVERMAAALDAERQRAEQLQRAMESAHYGLVEEEGQEWWLAAETLEKALAAAPPAAPPPSDPLVQRVVEAADKWAAAICAVGGAPKHAIRTAQEDSLWPAENELMSAVAALRSSRERNRA